jgi:nucleoside-diphosphate-sugar epimerase
MKVLFIGGTGIISSACSQLALDRDIELYLLNRGQSFRPVPAGAQVIYADIRNPESARNALQGMEFDAVVDWIALCPTSKSHLDLFKRAVTDQYIFISSASAYQNLSRVANYRIHCFSQSLVEYSRNKIACEELLVHAYREDQTPITIVRLRTPTMLAAAHGRRLDGCQPHVAG